MSVDELFPNEQDLGSRRQRKNKKNKRNSSPADIILVNSTHSLSTKPVKDIDRDVLPLVDDDKVIGFVTGQGGERLKYFSLKMFKGEDFVASSCTDAIGKFVFTDLKPGKYQLSTNEGRLMEIRLK